jgi:Large polyvalent protein associated domain 29
MPQLAERLNGSSVLHYSTKETAVCIRTALKQAFPCVKFSVRISLYSMGSSIDVGWTDGPTEPEVDHVLDRFYRVWRHLRSNGCLVTLKETR